jgi:dihydrofolate reductase
MRKVTFGGAPSLDNYFAREDGTVDWLMWSDEAAEVMGDYWKTIDTVLMGRKTYEAARAMTKGKSNPYPGMKSYVFSRTLKATPRGSVDIISRDAAKFVRKLKKERGKGICVMGGGKLAHALFEAGLIDEVGFNIHPVLVGSGIPLFYPLKRQVDLELIDCKRFKNGCVCVTYRVKN